MLELVRRARAMAFGSKKLAVCTQRILFVWAIKELSNIAWLDGKLEEAIALAPPGLLRIRIYVSGKDLDSSDAMTTRRHITEKMSLNMNAIRQRDAEQDMMSFSPIRPPPAAFSPIHSPKSPKEPPKSPKSSRPAQQHSRDPVHIPPSADSPKQSSPRSPKKLSHSAPARSSHNKKPSISYPQSQAYPPPSNHRHHEQQKPIESKHEEGHKLHKPNHRQAVRLLLPLHYLTERQTASEPESYR